MEFFKLLNRTRPCATFIVAGTHDQSKIRQRLTLFVPLHGIADVKATFGVESGNQREASILN